jgi:hypothetical protein
MWTSSRLRTWLAFFVALGWAAGCHAVLGLTDYEVRDTTSGTGAGATGGAGGALPCSVPSDCPGQDSSCGQRLCTAGACGRHDEAAGTSCSEAGGVVCDGTGQCVECVGPNDCTPPAICQSHQCVSPTCANGQQDGNETGMDCGGSDCAPCANGQGCLLYSDCASQFCDHGGQGGGGGSSAGGTGGAGGAGNSGAGAWGGWPQSGGSGGAGGAPGGAGGAGGAPGPGTCAACVQQSSCADAPASWCDASLNGGACVPEKASGEPCAAGYQCTSGACPLHDLVCCDTACGRPCEACLGAKTGGQDGACSPVASGQDPDNECQAHLPCVAGGLGCNGDAAGPACVGPCEQCTVRFGGQPYVYEICSEDVDRCTLRANNLTASCRDICEHYGTECLSAFGDLPEGTCGLGGPRSCGQAGPVSSICRCSLSCGASPPCPPPQICTAGICN